MAVTLSTLRDRVRAQVGETTATYFTTAQINDWLNEGQQVLSLRLPDDCLTQLTKISTTAFHTDGTIHLYDHATHAYEITDFLRLKAVRVNYGSVLIMATFVDPADGLQRHGAYASESAAEEDPIAFIANRDLHVLPTGFTANEVFYIASPVDMDASTNFALDDEYAFLAVDWALYRAFERDRSFTASTEHSRVFEAAMKNIWSTHFRSHRQEERTKRT
ncbi:MAG: hypothetical protein ACE5D3_01605 [Candidatus Binatia bacterium]